MVRSSWCVAALAAASVALPARAQDAELQKLREEIRQMKEAYERRIEALEKRLQATEAQAQKAQDAASPQPSQPSGRAMGESAFNPAVSLILNGTAASLKRDPERYRINGFVPTGGEVAPPRRGLSLGESELALSASVDPHFRGTLIAALRPEGGIEVEEGYVQTLALANGFTVRAGRFFSGVGYQNQIHAHAWDFADAPLALKAFLGGRLSEDGAQVKWVAPTGLYWDLGAELGRGRTFPGADRDKNGAGSAAFFSHLGGDLGASYAWQAGLSHFRTSPRDRAYEDLDSAGAAVTNSFTGRSRLWGLDGVLKWAPEGNPRETSLKLQGEYFRRAESGSLTYDTRAASLGTQSASYRSRQSGWYLQGVYQFVPQWRAGYRYDRLSAGTTSIGLVETGALGAANFPILARYSPRRSSFMVDWSASEFSRIRLQLARDYSRMGEPDSQIFLQYIMSLGAHGAHRF